MPANKARLFQQVTCAEISQSYSISDTNFKVSAQILVWSAKSLSNLYLPTAAWVIKSCKSISATFCLASSNTSSIAWLFIQEYVSVSLKLKCVNFRVNFFSSWWESKYTSSSKLRYVRGWRLLLPDPTLSVCQSLHKGYHSHLIISSTVHPTYWKSFKQNPFHWTRPTKHNLSYKCLYDVFWNRKWWFKC